ncbi:hypothetical protein ACFLZP_02450 [Patescibacteria group bacterium]
MTQEETVTVDVTLETQVFLVLQQEATGILDLLQESGMEYEAIAFLAFMPNRAEIVWVPMPTAFCPHPMADQPGLDYDPVGVAMQKMRDAIWMWGKMARRPGEWQSGRIPGGLTNGEMAVGVCTSDPKQDREIARFAADVMTKLLSRAMCGILEL